MTVNVTKPAINLREKLSELDFDKVPFQKMPSGSVLQAVQEALSYNDNSGFFLSTTSTSFQSTVFSASITPSSASSKILVFVTVQIYGNGAVSIYRNGSTNLGDSSGGFGKSEKGSGWSNHTFSYLDSPSTTSSTSYVVYGKSTDGGTFYIGGDLDIPNTITLMEIAA
jgi:hypothetical protein